MKTLKALLVAIISFLCVRTANAQAQCSAPSLSATYRNDTNPTCPTGGPNAVPYILLGMSITGTATFTCTSTANAVSPPGPNVVYWSYYEGNYTGSGGPQTGFGERYCNTNNAPYSTYDCPPNVRPNLTTATSPSDYNRFYNRAYSYTADTQNGSCIQSNFNQDFQECNGLACQPTSCPDPNCTDVAVDYCAYPGTGCPSGWNPDNTNPSCCVRWVSPVIVDVSGKGFVLTSAAGGVSFDILGTGHPIQMAWTASGADNAFLALPGADGLVHNGKQLFGDFTPQPPSTTPNGFAALAVYDDPKNGGNGEGIIDARDDVFASLRLWIDANHDGISQPEELHTLPSLGVTSISLNYKAAQRTDQYGNVFRYRAQVDPGDPTNTGRMAYDVFFVTSSPTSKNIPRSLIPRSLIPTDTHKCTVPVPTKGGMLSTSGK